MSGLLNLCVWSSMQPPGYHWLSGGLSRSYMPKGYLEVTWFTMANFFYETLQKKDSGRCMFIVCLLLSPYNFNDSI